MYEKPMPEMYPTVNKYLRSRSTCQVNPSSISHMGYKILPTTYFTIKCVLEYGYTREEAKILIWKEFTRRRGRYFAKLSLRWKIRFTEKSYTTQTPRKNEHYEVFNVKEIVHYFNEVRNYPLAVVNNVITSEIRMKYIFRKELYKKAMALLNDAVSLKSRILGVNINDMR